MSADSGPLQVSPRERVMLVGALIVGFGLAVLAAVLCIVGMGDVRHRVDVNNQTAQIERQAGRVIEQVGHSLVAFTATSIDDLSADERKEILAKTDAALTELKQSVIGLRDVLKLLPSEHQAVFAKSIASITHSWQELRDDPVNTRHPAEKAYHFLRILEDLDLVRGCLTVL